MLRSESGAPADCVIHLGDEVSCCPLPCEPTVVMTTTWGRIKAAFR